MGTKLQTVIINPNLLTEEQVANGILDIMHKKIKEAILEEGGTIPEKTPSISGSLYIEMSKPNLNYPMQMIFQHTSEEYGDILFDANTLASKLSKQFLDIPFIRVGYHSVVGTGNASVYLNGECIQKTNGEEGDRNKNIGPVFQKYFGIPYKKDKAWKIIDAWFGNCYYYGQYNITSYSNTLYNLEEESENKRKRDLYGMYQRAIDIFKEHPAITKEEYNQWVKEKEIDVCYYEMGKNIYEKDYKYYNEKTYTSTMFQLTEGNVFSKTPVTLLEQAKEISPFEWFRLQREAREDLEDRKDEKYGPRPKSYRLTKEQLQALDYEEQKREAYRLREIAKKRGDHYNGLSQYGDGQYASGIQIQTPFKEKEYVQFEEKIGRVKFIRLVADDKEKTYQEEAMVCVKGEGNWIRHYDLRHLEQYQKVETIMVGEEWIVNDCQIS